MAIRFKCPVAVFFFPEPPSIPAVETSFRTLPAEELATIPRTVRHLLRRAQALQGNLADLNDGRNPAKRLITHDLQFPRDRGGEAYEWAKRNSGLFVTPDAKEAAIVASIFQVKHFQANIERQKLLRGGRGADPFLVARAHATGTCLLTLEQFRENAAKIPNICKHFGVDCVDLNGFVEREGWAF